MMAGEITQSIILGLVQGIGEFLPISSTAHLVLAPFLFGWQDPGLYFDIALHFGTLIAVVSYFHRDWVMIFQATLRNLKNRKGKSAADIQNGNPDLLWLIIIATIPGALAGYFLERQVESVFRNPLLIALMLSFVGLILYLADKYLKKEKSINQLGLKDAIIIGLSQAAAIIPGVSRSGATITAGLLRGFDRVSAAKFSFLLSTPIIFGATISHAADIANGKIGLNIFIGVVVSALSGYLTIKYLFKFIERVSYKIFFWYRLALAVLIVIVYFS